MSNYLSKNKFLQFSIIAVVVLFFAYIIYPRFNLKSNYKLSTANVLSVGNSMSKNGNWLIEYEFKINDSTTVKGSSFFPLIMPQGKMMNGRKIPIAYLPKDPSTNELLIHCMTWGQYGLKCPDSLNWLNQYIDAKKIIFSY